MSEPVWLCIEWSGVPGTTPRVSNGPGGPDHCYFTSKRRHIPECGWYWLSREQHEAFVVEFDYRSDDGPMLVGPFSSRGQAQSWLDSQGSDFAANVTPLTAHVGKPYA